MIEHKLRFIHETEDHSVKHGGAQLDEKQREQEELATTYLREVRQRLSDRLDEFDLRIGPTMSPVIIRRPACGVLGRDQTNEGEVSVLFDAR